MNDWQLVSAYARGDEQAFEGLVRRYFPVVYSAAVRQVRDPHLAEEIAQSVFILFSRKAGRLSPNVLLTGWFLRTTRFVARDVWKQMRRRLNREQLAGAWAAASQQGEPGSAGLAPLLDEALLALSGTEQECVMARFIDGQSFREIGERQRITEDTAQKRVSRSLEKMRAFLARRGLKVAVPSISALLAADLAGAAGPHLVEATLHTVQAAVHGQAGAGASLFLANRIARVLLWRAALKVGLVAVLAVVLTGAGFVAWDRTQQAVAPVPFQVSDNRIEVLGRAWAVVVQRAAFVVTFPQGRPPAGNPNRAAYDQATAFVLTETTRVSSELGVVLQTGRDREQVAEFLTVELRETLGLDPRQQAEVFAQLRARVLQGATFGDGLQALRDTKAGFATALRQRLSAEQRRRFDRTYGSNAIGLLVFPELVVGGG